jgi:membrane protease YdiL (CAAX protease family)
MPDEPSTVNGGLRAAPWSGSELLLGVFLAWLFWPAMVQATLQGVGFYRWFYGPELVATAESKTADADDKRPAALRMALWPSALAAPFQVLTFPLLFSAFSGTRLEQLGLTRRQLGRNLLSGLVGVLVLSPVVFATYSLIQQLYVWSGESGVERHALEMIARGHLFPSEWVLLIFTATIAAPLREELVFRGVLQPWLAARPWGGHAAMLGAFVFAVWYRWDQLLTAWPQGVGPFAEAATPALVVLALLPVYLVVWWRSRTPVAPAIFGTALLFGFIHDVWPTPIPLFVLALGLGLLAQRTRSLVGPIVLHSLFNGISCVQLILGW